MTDYKQKRWANLFQGYQGGWCLEYVQNAYKSRHKYDSAEEQRQACISQGTYHEGEYPPLPVECPIFFSIKGIKEGHIAIRLANGQVASSTLEGWHDRPYIHNSIHDLELYYDSAYETHYLGWSENVGNKTIVKPVKRPKHKKRSKNMYMVQSKGLERTLFIIVDTKGLRIQTLTNADDRENLKWGADLSLQRHGNLDQFLSHMWSYGAIRKHYGDWANRQNFIKDIMNTKLGDSLYFEF